MMFACCTCIPSGNQLENKIKIFPFPNSLELSVRDISADFDIDYTMPISTDVTFEPGDESKEVLVTIFGDPSIEVPETFEVAIRGLEKNTVVSKPDVATVTINDVKYSSKLNILIKPVPFSRHSLIAVPHMGLGT